MKHIIEYKLSGNYPVGHKLNHNKKKIFRTTARRFRLLDSGELECTVKGLLSSGDEKQTKWKLVQQVCLVQEEK